MGLKEVCFVDEFLRKQPLGRTWVFQSAWAVRDAKKLTYLFTPTSLLLTQLIRAGRTLGKHLVQLILQTRKQHGKMVMMTC